VIESVQVIPELFRWQVARDGQFVHPASLAQLRSIRDPGIIFAPNFQSEEAIDIELDDHARAALGCVSRWQGVDGCRMTDRSAAATGRHATTCCKDARVPRSALSGLQG